MGFGLLFIGYFFYLPLSYNGFDLLPDIIGVLIMFSALRRLSFYCPGNRFFRLAKVILVPMGALSVGYVRVSGGVGLRRAVGDA